MNDRNPAPTINPKLLEKLLAMEFEDLADALCDDPDGARRMLAADAETLETTIIHDQPEPVWPIEPLTKPEDAIYLIDVPSRRNHIRQSTVFIATADYQNLAVPIKFLPADCIPDPLLKKWHWWRGTGWDKLGTDAACRNLARKIVRQFDRMENAPGRPKDLDVRFEIKTPKAVHEFMTRHDWRGLWAPLCMRPEGVPDARAAMFTKILREKEIQGKREIKKYARRMAYEYDKVKLKPKPPKHARGPFKSIYLSIEYQDRWELVRAWMAHGRPNGCSQSQAVRNLIDDQLAKLPPESEWDENRYPWPGEEDE